MSFSIMPPHSKNSDLAFITQQAQQLRLNLEAAIESAHEAEVDRISTLYEVELEKVFSFKCQTQSCVATKLTFIKDLLSIDHPMTHLVERTFESLSADVEYFSKL